jgi:sialidase-1
MGSTPGAFRFKMDVLKNGPVDLLFVEAAVNDDTNATSDAEIIRGMEGIVRHARIANPGCDVVMMYFVDPGKMADYRQGKTPKVIGLHEKVAEHYLISSINLAKEVTERIDGGEFDWENDFKDLHPSPFGHGIYSKSITKFLDGAWNGDFKNQAVETHVLPEPLDKYSYFKGVLIGPNPPKPAKGWEMVQNWKPADGKGTRENFVNVPMFSGSYPGEIIKFHFRGNAIGIAVAAGPDSGIIEYSIDGQPWQKQDLYTRWSKSLHLPWFYTLGSRLKGKKHVIQIRTTKERNPESIGTACRIRYFYVNGY